MICFIKSKVCETRATKDRAIEAKKKKLQSFRRQQGKLA